MPDINIDGVKINYHFSGDASRVLPTVVFIHGACQGLWNWKYQFPFFKTYSRFNLVAVDLPGHGSSEGAAFRTIGEYSDFICRFSEQLNLNEILLVGHSMGGRIAQVFMLENPEKVIGCVLCGTAARLRVTRATFNAIEKGFDYFAGIATSNSFSEFASEELKEEFKSRLMSSDKDSCLNDLVACNEFDVSDDIFKVDVPVLILAAENDLLAPVKYSRDLNTKIKGSTLRIMESCGHFMMLEKSEEFNRHVKEFMDIV